MVFPTIVIAAYNRPMNLQKLLLTLQVANIPSGVRLIISIDYSGDFQVQKAAEDFQWPHGPKLIITHDHNLGLRNHILSCGDLTLDYQSVIVLEDDLLVSPYFYDYALAALAKYETNEDITGISLYQHEHNEITGLPHEIVSDGYNAYFMQIPSSWGQLWNKKQWLGFRNWYDKGQQILDDDFIPQEVKNWPESSWKKYFWKYCWSKKKYFVYPTTSFSTNSGALGVHHSEVNLIHQSNLSMVPPPYKFPLLNETLNRFDSFFEIESEVLSKISLELQNCEIDFNGIKPLHLINKKFMLSTRMCTQALKSYSISTYPLITNFINPIPNHTDSGIIHFAKTKHFVSEINPQYIQQVCMRTDKKIKSEFIHLGRTEVLISYTYLLGSRLLKVLSALPLFIQRIVKKTPLFAPIK